MSIENLRLLKLSWKQCKFCVILQNDPSDRMFQFKEESITKTAVKPDLTNFG